MGTAIYRVTGIFLSLIVALLGATTAILLYYAGQDAIDVFYKDSTYMDEYHRIHKRMPTDDWYGELILKGWAFGFVYVVPGLTGLTASIFFLKCPKIVHLIISVLALVIGSFIHTFGTAAIVVYRVLTVNEIIRYDSWPTDCIYLRDDHYLQQEYKDEKCESGRKVLTMAIAAVCVTFAAWLFLLSEIVYTGFTFHNIDKARKKSIATTQPDEDRPRRRPYPRRRRSREPQSTATTEDPPSLVAEDVTRQQTPSTQTTPPVGRAQPNEEMGGATAVQQYDNLAYDGADDKTDRSDVKGDYTTIDTEATVSPEMVHVDEGEKTAM